MKLTKTINWIFFDAGGVLLDETQYENQRLSLILQAVKTYNPQIIRPDILAVRPKASAMLGSLTANMLKLTLKNDRQVNKSLEFIKTNWDGGKSSFVRPEAQEIVKNLEEKYNLGLLANQPVATKEKLKQAGVLQYFKFQDVSEDFNLRKPDPKFFQAIFKATGADPKKSAIIDDNIERGLLPAKKLGMTTVWFKLEDREAVDNIDFTVSNLEELLEIFL